MKKGNTALRTMLPFLVEHRGLEPLTPTLPVLCAPNCANAPPFTQLFYHVFAEMSSVFYQRIKNVLCIYFLIRQSLVAVFQIDDSAILKSSFEECVLHREIVAVGINA